MAKSTSVDTTVPVVPMIYAYTTPEIVRRATLKLMLINVLNSREKLLMYDTIVNGQEMQFMMTVPEKYSQIMHFMPFSHLPNEVDFDLVRDKDAINEIKDCMNRSVNVDMYAWS